MTNHSATCTIKRTTMFKKHMVKKAMGMCKKSMGMQAKTDGGVL
jgi:hypothetical protein